MKNNHNNKNKKKKYTITMENPCSKDWNSMTPTEKGMFCGQCSKHVVDLAFASDDEILKHMTGNDKFCGRFSEGQLNRPLTPTKVPNQNSFFSRMFSAFFLIASSRNIAFGQTTKKEPVAMEEIKKENKKNMEEWIVPAESMEKTGGLKNTIAGNICDRDGKPAALITVMIPDTAWKTFTDSSGNFKFELPDSILLKDSLSFEITGNHYAGRFIIEKQNYQLIQQHKVAYQVFYLGKAIGVKTQAVNNPLPSWYQSVFDFLR
jgi:hypothetical protein